MKLIFSLPKCYNRYPRKATKYEKLNDNGKVPTYIKPKPIFYCIFDFTKDKGYFNFTFKPK